MDKLQGLWRSAQHKAKQSSERAAETLKQSADAAAQRAARNLQRNASHLRDAAVDSAQKLQQTTQRKAREAATKLQQTTQHKAREAAQTLRTGVAERAQKVQRTTEHRALEATRSLREGVSDSAQRLRQQSATVVERLDPRAQSRRIRNRLLALGFAAIAVYGFASAAPDALSRYAIERAKMEEEARRRESEAAARSGKLE